MKALRHLLFHRIAAARFDNLWGLIGIDQQIGGSFPEPDKTMHELWLRGLPTRDFEPSLRALVGGTAPLSPSSISRINKQYLVIPR